MPQNSNFQRFHPQLDFTVMAPNHRWDPLRSILGPMVSHWVKKWVKTVKNYHAPKFEFSTHRGHLLWPKFDFTVMAPYHGGAPLGSILGPMGSYWVQKMGQNRKKLPCPKIRIFDYPADIDFGQIRLYGYGAKSRWGPSWVHLVANGVPLGKKMGQNCKKLPCPKIRIFDPPRSSTLAKIRLYGYGAKSRWGPPRVHLWANGVLYCPKNGSKP